VASEPGKGWVAIILALGLSIAVVTITAAVLYDAIFSPNAGLSENATQVLIAVFGGIIGVLGGYVGYQAAKAANRDED
jgi:hypothetical protein